jgi:cell division protease FtsH
MIDFLKNPAQYTRLGGKLPKGVLLVGPPGTGKTLLARAVAGEADVPFFSLTGSEFVEMFVGVGAARVRDLFKKAKSKAPCIVFIDEIDAIGKSRGQSIQVNANDERENTLNQLLSEMDGFEPGDNLIVMASTNRPEVLDRALLRPGRFDRQVLIDRPDLNGRVEIIKVHTRELSLDPGLDLNKIASQTPGFSGADLANICNEAALMASRKKKKYIEETDFQEAIERIVAGLEKKNRLINPKEKKIVAYHESGHALVGHYTEGADPVHKVSIVPRGLGALGYTLQTPLEDRYLMTKSELEGKIKGLLGGRAAEEITFGEISTGAANDLERATHIATEMVTIYGMSGKLLNLSLKKNRQNDLLGLDSPINKRSEQLERIVDEEVLNTISSCYEEVIGLIRERKDKLAQLAEELMEKEVLQEEAVKRILK